MVTELQKCDTSNSHATKKHSLTELRYNSQQ